MAAFAWKKPLKKNPTAPGMWAKIAEIRWAHLNPGERKTHDAPTALESWDAPGDPTKNTRQVGAESWSKYEEHQEPYHYR